MTPDEVAAASPAVQMHDGPDPQSPYGLLRAMLPPAMGDAMENNPFSAIRASAIYEVQGQRFYALFNFWRDTNELAGVELFIAEPSADNCDWVMNSMLQVYGKPEFERYPSSGFVHLRWRDEPNGNLVNAMRYKDQICGAQYGPIPAKGDGL